jgi:hypothetical protein
VSINKLADYLIIVKQIFPLAGGRKIVEDKVRVSIINKLKWVKWGHIPFFEASGSARELGLPIIHSIGSNISNSIDFQRKKPLLILLLNPSRNSAGNFPNLEFMKIRC